MTKTPLGSALVVSEMTALTLIPPLVIAALISLCLTTSVSFIGSSGTGTSHSNRPHHSTAEPPRKPAASMAFLLAAVAGPRTGTPAAALGADPGMLPPVRR